MPSEPRYWLAYVRRTRDCRVRLFLLLPSHDVTGITPSFGPRRAMTIPQSEATFICRICRETPVAHRTFRCRACVAALLVDLSGSRPDAPLATPVMLPVRQAKVVPLQASRAGGAGWVETRCKRCGEQPRISADHADSLSGSGEYCSTCEIGLAIEVGSNLAGGGVPIHPASADEDNWGDALYLTYRDPL